MKRKLNKWLSGVLAACVLFTTVPVYAINDVSGTETSTEVVETSEETQSSENETSSTEETIQESSESTKSSETTSEEDSKVENTNTESIENTIETSSEEQTSEIVDEMLNISPMNLGDEEEPSTDNWELSTVFYDSTVDNGKTPLTSIDWDASDGSYKEGTPRVITVQINYKNANAATTYQPGEIEISIPNLVYSNGWKSSSGEVTNLFGAGSAQWNSEIVVSANDSTHTGYDWNFEPFKYGSSNYTSPNNYAETLRFTNNKIIEEKTNFEGSIQIIYTITPCAESQQYEYYIDQIYIEKHNDSCVHEYATTLKASLSIAHTVDDDSNIISSPNYPSRYPANMTEDKYYWEYFYEGADRLKVSVK